ncbi:hypothetical protein CGC58_07465 [Capnocytophaga stomatis]|uniref:Uncharacterized protein n=1 Tax=Capnocytophaga stomatis TaxID=1848904 RepID=A0A250FX59_9FLAO|nr:hypothetical protein [Capnocytophaga stomatis]ATA89581.1 hypothetical protein CGC58_07465 [Capnocytophaga stomatis]
MINTLIQLFKTNKILSHIDNFTQYEYIAYVGITDSTRQLNRSLYNKINSYFKKLGYDWNLEIEEISYTISQKTFEDLPIEYYNYYDDLTNVKLTIKIFKSLKNTIIFNQKLFEDTLNKMSLYDILSYFQKREKPILITSQYSNISLKTNIIGYNSNIEDLENKIISIQCLFYNYSEFRFAPENFCTCEQNGEDILCQIINKLYFIYLLIFLFDTSEIKDNNVILKLKGHKVHDFNLDFSMLNVSNLEEYKKIYNWVYSEKDKVEDKLGIARNIIAFYLKDNDISLDNRVFPSIISANQLYIKGNLTKYIDSRNKIYEQVDQITNKINTSLDLFLSNFQKSVFAFVSFYIGVFAIRIFNKADISNVINKEATFFGIGILLLSILFMLFSLIILQSDINRVKQKYNLIKIRFQDILNENDINKILNKDEEFNKDLMFYNKKKRTITFLWIITILILFFILLCTSEYLKFLIERTLLH